MELIYLWINQDEYGIISNQEFNFSPTHIFNLSKGDSYKLTYHSSETINIYKNANNNVVSNITAIVGENGAGKTTLLNYLAGFPPIITPFTDTEGYEEYNTHSAEVNKSISVFHNSNDNCFQIYYYLYNEQESIIRRDLQVVCEYQYNMFELSSSNMKEILETHEVYKSTQIYLTNSFYGAGSSYRGENGKLTSIFLSQEILNTLQRRFFKTLTKSENNELSPQFRLIQNVICENKTSTKFQQICDLIYFNYMVNISENSGSYFGKISPELIVTFDSLMRYYQKTYPTCLTQETDDENLSSTEQFFSKMQNEINNSPLVKNVSPSTSVDFDFIDILYINLLVELHAQYNVLELNDEVEGFMQENSEKDSIEQIALFLEKKIVELPNSIEKDYYQEALVEIKRIKEICDKVPDYKNTLPVNDLGCVRGKHFLKNGTIAEYKSFLREIDALFQNGNSFVLKYLSVENLGMSSGERALQNIFSWLYLIPHFSKIDSGLENPLTDNITLMIDELDLYMHPEWQRQIIGFLISELNHQYPNKKIQVILSTHSPLSLSDIPKSNTIYLKNECGHTIVDTHYHKETFASNIYTILNDTFYLNNMIGEYAESIIDEIIQEINKEPMGNFEILSTKINIIGEPVLQKKLTSMLRNKSESAYSLVQLKKDREEIERKIKELESGVID